MSKIAFLFLTIDNPNFPQIWDSYFENNESRYTVYIHPKYPDQLTWRKNNCIKKIVPTEWGRITNAYIELIGAALRDKDNAKFVVISESCVPIQSFDKFYNMSMADKRSWIKLMPVTEYDRNERINTQQNIPDIQFKKHYARFMLSRNDAKKLYAQKDNLMQFFNKMPIGDEFFLSVLQPPDLDSKNYYNFAVTFDDWGFVKKEVDVINAKIKALYEQTGDNKEEIANLQAIRDNIRKNPKTIIDVADDIEQIKSCNSFFYRKFDKTSNILDYYDEIIKAHGEEKTLGVPSKIQPEPVPVESKKEIIQEPINEQERVLLLGDVIVIHSPGNEALDNRQFIVEYVSHSLVKIIDIESLAAYQIKVLSDGTLDDETIVNVEIISRSAHEGYARQNGLLPNNWITIYFNGDIQEISTFKITNLEEDMIEITSYPDNKVYYLNFNYQGIPLEFNIQSIVIRDPPKQTIVVEEPEPEVEEEFNADKDITINQNDEDDMIIFGNYLAPVTEYVNISKSEYRYDIDVQTNELMESLLASVPRYQLTREKLVEFHIIVSRFKQLRQEFSTFDKNGNVDDIIIHGPNYKPLVESLTELNIKLDWIIPVVKQHRKIFCDDFNNKKPEGILMNNDIDVPDATLIGQNEAINEFYDLATKYHETKTTDPDHNPMYNFMNAVQPILTPYISIDNSDMDVIYTGKVNTPMTYIVDNKELSTSVSNNDVLSNKVFYIGEATTGEIKYDIIENNSRNFRTVQSNMTPNDTINIVSILTLPEPVVKFSAIRLPSTSIYDKVNFHNTQLNLWEYLRTVRQVAQVPVNDVKYEFNYTESNFLNSVKNYTLTDKSGSNKDKFNSFLKCIIPNTNVLFGFMKKKITGKLSIIEIVKQLEPFLIYQNALTYNNYKKIHSFIWEQAKLYTHERNTNKSLIYGLGNTFPKKNMTRHSLQNIYNADNNRREVYRTYNVENLTSSELLANIYNTDGGQLFFAGLAAENSDLFMTPDLEEIFNEELKLEVPDESTCKNYKIVKLYKTLTDLEADNKENVVYVDKEFDSTNYDTIEKYTNERNKMSHEDFTNFLIEKLTNDKVENPTVVANALITGRMTVNEGEYAILFDVNVHDTEKYYIRNGGVWVIDSTINPISDFNIKSQEILCNLQSGCEYDKKTVTCNSDKTIKKRMKDKMLKNYVNKFDENNVKKLNNLAISAKSNFTNVLNRCIMIKEYNKQLLLVDNMKKYELGITGQKIKQRIQSPYSQAFDIICGQADFVKRQNDISRFVVEYTREFNEGAIETETENVPETIHWRYCIKTGVRLVPQFMMTLANAYITNPNTYQFVVDELVKNIGILNNDGDKWIDKYSMRTIKAIDFDTEEGYDDGFKKSSRSVMEIEGEKEYNIEQIKEKLSPISEKIWGVVNTLADKTHINIFAQTEIIMQLVNNLLSNEISEKIYNEEAAKSNKRTIAYSDYIDYKLVYTTVGAFILVVQTSIPPLKYKKTFPGCSVSFDGYPFGNPDDDSALLYLNCVIKKMAKVNPWHVVKRGNTDNPNIGVEIIKKQLSLILNDASARLRIKDKIEYNLSLKDIDINVPVEHSINSSFPEFKPPLYSIKIKNLQNVTEEFYNGLKTGLKSDDSDHWNKINTMKHKIVLFSLSVQEYIGKIIDDKDMLMRNHGTNKPYIENSCCDNTKLENCIQYFTDQDKSIITSIKTVRDLTVYLNDIFYLMKPGIFSYKGSTKSIYTDTGSDFSEETIYQAFMTHCNLLSHLPIPRIYESVCKSKPNSKISNKNTLEENIKMMKTEDINYTKEQLNGLLTIIGNKNTVQIDEEVIQTPYQNLQNVITQLPENLDETCDLFLDEIGKILNTTGEIPENYTEDTRNFLNEHIGIFKQEIESAITGVTINPSDLEDISIFYGFATEKAKKRNSKRVRPNNEITEWRYTESKKRSENLDNLYSDDDMYRTIQYYKNVLKMLVANIPQMIIKTHTLKGKKMKYWNNVISNIHQEKLVGFVTDVYSPIADYIETFTKHDNENPILTHCLEKMRRLCSWCLDISKNLFATTEVPGSNAVFNNRTTTLIFKFMIFYVLTTYIKTAAYYETHNISYVEEEMSIDEHNSKEKAISGLKMSIKTDMSNLLIAASKMIISLKNENDFSFESIEDQTFKTREAEKLTFTSKLDILSDEDRRRNTVMQANKLGDWGKGLAKSLRVYDKDAFDENAGMAEILEKAEGAGMEIDDYVNEMRADAEEKGELNECDNYDEDDPDDENYDENTFDTDFFDNDE